MVVFLLGLSLH